MSRTPPPGYEDGMDPRERFTSTVEQYRRYRPDYPPELYDWLRATVHGSRAVDLGAGTGILTRALAERGWDVVGVEPNAAMRAAAAEQGGHIVEGTAEQTGLPDRSADLVIGAQAFHWFDLDRALPEIDRIGVPGARVVAVWNVRGTEGFAAAYDTVLERFSTEYLRVPKPGPTLEALERLRPRSETVTFAHGQILDREGLRGRAWSSSYVAHGVVDRAGFDAALDTAFDGHAHEGVVELRYDTVVRTWTVPD